MNSGVYWSIGGRAVNEDSVVLEEAQTDRGTCVLLGICDGIGTLDHGEIASGYVAECLVGWFYRTGIQLGHASASVIRRSVNRCLYDCHTELKLKAKDAGIKWGSTCTFVCIYNSRCICVHLGDSKAYRTRSGTALCLTKVHRNSRGELVKCVGSMNYFEPEITVVRLSRGSGILIVSDGFCDRMTDGELGSMLDMRGEIDDDHIERRLNAMAAENKRRGGTDNMSAVYVRR